MGQRTQILLVKNKKDGSRSVNLYHLQWGFGRLMYLALMDLFISDYCKDTWPKDYSYDKDVFPKSVAALNRENNRYDLPAEMVQNLNLNDIETVKEVFEYADNNNGGLVIEMTEAGDGYSGSEFKIAFLLGDEDTECEYDGKVYNKGNDKEAFTRYLTPAEYGRMNGGRNYSDEPFVKMFQDFCDYFGIECVGSVEHPMF